MHVFGGLYLPTIKLPREGAAGRQADFVCDSGSGGKHASVPQMITGIQKLFRIPKRTDTRFNRRQNLLDYRLAIFLVVLVQLNSMEH